MGEDPDFPSVNIVTPLTPGFSLNYQYKETPLTIKAGLNYKHIQFKDDSKRNIPVENNGPTHNVGFQFQILWDLNDTIRLGGHINYAQLYFYQSRVLENKVVIKSSLGMITQLGLEYDLLNKEFFKTTVYGFYGLSTANSTLQGGSSHLYGARASYKYSENSNMISDLSYSQTQNNTKAYDTIINTNQARARFNLKLGLERKF